MNVPVEKTWTVPNRLELLPAVSRDVHDWLETHNLPSRAKYVGRLAVEEVAGNAIKYGFPQGGDHAVTVRIAIERDYLRLDFTDDGSYKATKTFGANWMREGSPVPVKVIAVSEDHTFAKWTGGTCGNNAAAETYYNYDRDGGTLVANFVKYGFTAINGMIVAFIFYVYFVKVFGGLKEAEAPAEEAPAKEEPAKVAEPSNDEEAKKEEVK